MAIRPIQQLIRAQAVREGAGVTVHRSIGTQSLRHLDPFLMLDHFGSDNPNEYIAGFPAHPHRGFITFTYMLDGQMEHRDSMGNRGELDSGGVQWMKAASGVIHSEMPRQVDGLLRGFQLWINLPAAEKMSDPAYQEFPANKIPEVETASIKVRVLAGEYQGQAGVIKDPNTQVCYLDVRLEAQARFELAVPKEHQGFIYVFEGSATSQSHALPQHSLAVLGQGDAVAVTAGEKGTRFILVMGKPLGEPIVQYGPFVMNTREEIGQAMADYQNNQLVRKKAAFNV
ncbi:pirin family protein [uncultured Thiothrix sp.]|uniref:pirin family protein n=1 Tax=uncultured Thiothrix sp. TaxID=223185 RepID=UPI002637E2E9|nr:pirin family protein [uncultured Thiothrix sp.]HMT92826.1 pirin family protein [Thiolinea sp.]